MVFPHLPILYCMHIYQPVCYRYGVKRLVLQYWWHGTWAGLLSFNVRILVKQTTEWIPGIEVSVWKLLVSLIQSCMISVFHHCLLLNNSLLKMCLEMMLLNCLNKSRNKKKWSYVSNFNYFERFIFLLFVKCKCRVCKCCRFGGGGGSGFFLFFLKGWFYSLEMHRR